MVKFVEIVESGEFDEARQPKDLVAYTPTIAKGKVTKVTAMLKKDSETHEVFNDLFLTFKHLEDKMDRLNSMVKRVKEKQAVVDNTIREVAFSGLFDAVDILVTRVIDTSDITATMSKKTMIGGETHFDTEGFIRALNQMVPELSEKIGLLQEQFTKVDPDYQRKSTLKIADKRRASTAPIDMEESAFTDNLKSYISKVVNYFRSWGQKYDQKLAELKSHLQ